MTAMTTNVRLNQLVLWAHLKVSLCVVDVEIASLACKQANIVKKAPGLPWLVHYRCSLTN